MLCWDFFLKHISAVSQQCLFLFTYILSKPTKPNQKAKFYKEIFLLYQKPGDADFPNQIKVSDTNILFRKFCKYSNCSDDLLSPYLEKPSLNILAGKCKIGVSWMCFLQNWKKLWVSFLELDLIANLSSKTKFVVIYLLVTTVTTVIVGKG